MSRPRILDLFCGGGGCSLGYERAGFEVVGVDRNPKCERHYRRVCAGKFIAADALEYVYGHGHEYDAIHASPPCQAHSRLRHVTGKSYADLIPATRAALQAIGKPYVIENVPGAPLGGESCYLLMLCGTMFGLVTPDGRAEIRRHRLFETNWCFGLGPACRHGAVTVTVTGHSTRTAAYTARRKTLSVAGHAHEVVTDRQQAKKHVERNTVRETFSVGDARAAMGIDLPMAFLSQAIPPAYTQWLGARLLMHLTQSA